MAKNQDFTTPHANNQDDWAKLKPFRDPVSGKVLPQNPQGEPSPVGSPTKNQPGY